MFPSSFQVEDAHRLSALQSAMNIWSLLLMNLDKSIFQQQFSRFNQRILFKSGRPFTTFKEGLAFDWENYKTPLRKRALERLDKSLMNPTNIGYGYILERLIEAIEIPQSKGLRDNNLVAWTNQWGPNGRAHKKLLGHEPGSPETRRLEDWVCGFFRDEISPEDAFGGFCDLAGKNYNLVAYLFFLKDSRKFMPINPNTFDKSFVSLGLNLKTSNKCSWSNYSSYLEALGLVQKALAEMDGLGDVRLLDAHTFCFLLETDQLTDPSPAPVKRGPRADSAGPAASPTETPDEPVRQEGQEEPNTDEGIEKPDSWNDVAKYLVGMTVRTVQNSNGQKELVTKKLKELWMGRADLNDHILLLLKQQHYRCKLTGIEFQTDRSLFDTEMYPSLDRIDSDGPYSEENTQMVCRFINRWKSAKSDDKFRKLISVVRGGPY